MLVKIHYHIIEHHNIIMKLDNFPKILWINLNQSVDRRKYMNNLIGNYFSNIRIPAVNGFDENVINETCIQNSKLSPQENACTCSHITAIRYFLENTQESRVVVFEDDVSFDFLKMIPFDWSEFESNLPLNYSVIQLAVSCDRGGITDIKLVPINIESKSYCSTAYLISRRGAQEIIDKYLFVNGKLDLSSQTYATADSMIANTNACYSIPIFTYQTTNSLIHPYHLPLHVKSKVQQFKLWKNCFDNLKTFNKQKFLENIKSCCVIQV
ncbi:glycosyltransferase [Cotonvirus japonicus]|uniref:Glycosyltransferase n=1 Tax=Cotonvirus japonicus TaxID=2811091 RepID=A0ABM7NTD1_9VIRU|nr:glycosyltransferase [Cotonvirus japonicus]BCS83432.1 glycosyltransferase [Cotonvirus japonicus]